MFAFQPKQLKPNDDEFECKYFGIEKRRNKRKNDKIKAITNNKINIHERIKKIKDGLTLNNSERDSKKNKIKNLAENHYFPINDAIKYIINGLKKKNKQLKNILDMYDVDLMKHVCDDIVKNQKQDQEQLIEEWIHEEIWMKQQNTWEIEQENQEQEIQENQEQENQEQENQENQEQENQENQEQENQEQEQYYLDQVRDSFGEMIEHIEEYFSEEEFASDSKSETYNCTLSFGNIETDYDSDDNKK